MGLRKLLPGSTGVPTARYECRDCGATLEPDDDACSRCGSTEIAEYTF